MSTIKTGTTLTTAYQVVGDTTGALVIQTGSTPTTAVTISDAQVVALTNALPVTSGGTGAATLTGYVYGNGTGAFTASASIPNAATTATSANTANAIVARDASGNFTAGTVTAALNGNATTATTATNQSGGTVSATTASVSGNLSFNSGYGSSAVAYGCRAWVNFNGSGGAIRGSANVSSITVNGTGDYTVNFSTGMPDANYSAVGMAQTQLNNFGYDCELISMATGSVRVWTSQEGGGAAAYNNPYVMVSIFR